MNKYLLLLNRELKTKVLIPTIRIKLLGEPINFTEIWMRLTSCLRRTPKGWPALAFCQNILFHLPFNILCLIELPCKSEGFILGGHCYRAGRNERCVILDERCVFSIWEEIYEKKIYLIKVERWVELER